MARVEAAIGQLIPASQLQIGPVIGRGGFSTVHSGMLHDPSGAPIRREPLAIKRIAPYPESESGLARLCREVSIMRQTSHPNLLGIIGVSATPAALCLVTELMPRGSVYDWLHRDCAGVPPPLHMTLRILVDAAAALDHLHSRSPRIVHRDVKSLNLLLAMNFAVKLADFGLSREMWKTDPMSRVGTVQYIAPEVLLGQPYSHKCDVWSFGVVCWELLTARVPFDGMSASELARKVAVEGLRLPPPRSTPLPVLQLMARCWQGKPRQRPECSKLHRECLLALHEAQVQQPTS